MKLILLRHGESEWNLANKFTGWTDVALTPTGILEANFSGKQLLKKNILVRDCSTFCGLDENYIRIAVKNRIQNKLLVKELGEIKW